MDDIALVLFKKVEFMNGKKFIFGCSRCDYINNAFHTLLGSSVTLNHEPDNGLSCQHILKALGTFLYLIDSWSARYSESKSK